MSGVDQERDWKLLIDGDWVAGDSTYEIINPNTTEVVGHAPDASVAQANDAAAAAKAALPAWRDTPYEKRCEVLAEAAVLLEERLGDSADLVQAETGATAKIAGSIQLTPAADRFKFYSKPYEMSENLRPLPIGKSPLSAAGLMSAQVNRNPVGVVLSVTSYNFPIVNTAGKIAPALAMGNTCVIKPAPQDPLAVLEFAGILNEVFPPGVINVVTSSGVEAPSALVDSPDVNMVSFTGSTAVGTRIYEAGAKTMKRNLMELGGKGACIITEDADLGKAIGGIATVWGFHSGQICTAPTRVIVHESLYDQTVEQLTAVSAFMKVGDATADDTIVGPVITDVHRDRVEAFIQSGVDAGATMTVGGERPDLPGWFVAPTLLADCTPDMHVVQEEAFGPVVVVLKYSDEEEAINIANNSNYGLYSYIFSGDTSRAYRMATKIESGNVGLNVIQPHMEAPFGGFKMSGVGRDRGIHGLYAYSELQSINWMS